MRPSLLFLPFVALLPACAVVPPSAWTFDPTHPEPKPVLAVADALAVGAVTAVRCGVDAGLGALVLLIHLGGGGIVRAAGDMVAAWDVLIRSIGHRHPRECVDPS